MPGAFAVSRADSGNEPFGRDAVALAGPCRPARMAESDRWAFPPILQPKAEELSFDLQPALDAVVMLRAEIPDDAFTASILGTERIGSGIAIEGSGLVLTIGYLITEAEAIWLTTNDGKVVPAHALAYDYQTGFGLVQPLHPLPT